MQAVEHNNIFKSLAALFKKKSHTLGEVILLYFIIFFCLFLVLIIAELGYHH